MKSIREATMIIQLLELIGDRSYDILCDIVDALLFNTGTVQSVFNKWGIKVTVPVQQERQNLNTIRYVSGPYDVIISVNTYNSIVSAMLRGLKVEAIKAFRSEHPWGLREAKDFVEHVNASIPSTSAQWS